MKDRAQSVIATCRRIAEMSEEPGRTTRRFLTPPVRDVHEFLRTRMESLGMSARMDAAGNLRGLWVPTGALGKRLIVGSHIDSVPNAGAFDGVLGVALALEWVELAQELKLPFPIEVIAFSEEEGVRFGVPFIGSRAVAGRFDAALLALKDADGITLADAIRAFELDPSKIGEAALDDHVLGFVEMHIEQGPVLEAESLSVAAVTAIAGQSRLKFSFQGHANHVGTTPMNLRRDALAAAAEWIVAVEAKAESTAGLVATVGKIDAEPNAANVIAGSVSLSLDVRHADDGARRAAVDLLVARAQAIADKRGVTLDWAQQVDQPAVPMDEHLTADLTNAMLAARMPDKRMTSGAGHDAMVIAASVPAAMLFVRSPGGISHHPSETVREEDVAAALHVARIFLDRLAARFG
ncbi:MAG TPA: allantoate amidohydrolase [Terracidiphilus sp.]|nr:allantoate amidohydrolase [Terracidiphilus sp.]